MSIADDFLGPSSSYRSQRLLDFYVQHNDRNHYLRVPDSADVRALKGLIQKETGCPPCQQNLSGFRGSRYFILMFFHFYKIDHRRLMFL